MGWVTWEAVFLQHLQVEPEPNPITWETMAFRVVWVVFLQMGPLQVDFVEALAVDGDDLGRQEQHSFRERPATEPSSSTGPR